MAILIKQHERGYPEYGPIIIKRINDSMNKSGKYVEFSFSSPSKKEQYNITNNAENKATLKLLKGLLTPNKQGKVSKPNWNKAMGMSVVGTLKGKKELWELYLPYLNKDQLAGTKGDAKLNIGNRGDVAEGIGAAAVAARFVKKSGHITIIDVKNILKDVKNSKKIYNQLLGMQSIKSVFDSIHEKERDDYNDIKKHPKISLGTRTALSSKTNYSNSRAIAFTSSNRKVGSNRNGTVMDDVLLFIALSPGNLEALLNPKIQDEYYTDIYNSAVTYANSKVVRDWAYTLWENGRYDLIEVLAVGPVDQTGTKIDFAVIINKTPVNINISLKAGDVAQFGQVGGAEFTSMTEVFDGLGPISGKKGSKLPMNKIEKKYEEHYKANRIRKATQLAYKEAVTYIQNKHLNSNANQKKFIPALGSYIIKFATGTDKNMELIQFQGNDAKIFHFEKIADKLAKAGTPLYCHYFETSDKEDKGLLKKPKIVIWEGTDPRRNDSEPIDDGWTRINKDKILLSIRLKQENLSSGPYYRNLIEKGPRLAHHIATSASETVGDIDFKAGGKKGSGRMRLPNLPK